MSSKAVTASEAEAKGIELVHVSKLLGSSELGKDGDCEVYGGYVPYSVDGTFLLTDETLETLKVTDKYSVANYDEKEVEAKTVFTPVCQTAFCKSCGEELPENVQNNLKKPVTSTTTPTAADYEAAYGDWVYTLKANDELKADLFGIDGMKMDKNDVTTFNFLVEKNESSEESPKVTVYATYYDDSYTAGVKTWTFYGEASDVKFDYTSADKVRKLSFKLPDATSQTTGASVAATGAAEALKGQVVELSEDATGWTMKVNEGSAYKTVYSSVTGGLTASSYSASLTFDKNHTAHTFKVMTHYNVNRIEKGEACTASGDYSVPATQFLGLHYEECACGIKYKKVAHEQNATYVTKNSDTSKQHIKCEKCGYDSSTDAFFEVTVEPANDAFMVAKDVELSLSYSEYTPFNKDEIKITDWTAAEGVKVVEGGKFKVTGTGTLTYTAKSSD